IRDLPGDKISSLRVKLELLGEGQVSVDDVQLLDLDFTDAERLELSKIITLAEYKRKSGNLSECLRLLDGYWPRFLAANVAPAQPLAKNPSVKAPVIDEPTETPRSSGLMDRMRRALPSWR
ncbi:MAG TPA: hypothetical protein VG713_11230, partial [Pirellulales bacterium]|nr:hypothetical protein [Pirellulales bacterium]